MITLIDLDWTLLRGGNKAHADSFAWALRTVYGVEASLKEVDTEGLTDSEILMSILTRHGMAPERTRALIQDATNAMAEYFMKHEDEGIYIPLTGSL